MPLLPRQARGRRYLTASDSVCARRKAARDRYYLDDHSISPRASVTDYTDASNYTQRHMRRSTERLYATAHVDRRRARAQRHRRIFRCARSSDRGAARPGADGQRGRCAGSDRRCERGIQELAQGQRARKGRAAARGGAQDSRADRGAGDAADARGRQAADREPRRDGLERGLLRLLRRATAQHARPSHPLGRAIAAGDGAEGAVWRGRGDCAMELPDPADDLEGGPGAGGRQQRDHQAQRDDAADHAAVRRDLRSPAAGRGQHRHRLRRHGRARAGGQPAHAYDRVHRLVRHRPRDRAPGRRAGQEDAPGAGRQGCLHRGRGCRPGCGRAGRGLGRAAQRRAGLHLGRAGVCPREHSEAVHRSAGGVCAARCGSAPAWSRAPTSGR